MLVFGCFTLLRAAGQTPQYHEIMSIMSLFAFSGYNVDTMSLIGYNVDIMSLIGYNVAYWI